MLKNTKTTSRSLRDNLYIAIIQNPARILREAAAQLIRASGFEGQGKRPQRTERVGGFFLSTHPEKDRRLVSKEMSGYKIIRKTLICALLLTLTYSSLHSEGFRGDTLVYTPMGFHPISVIGKGMQVYCYSAEGKIVLGDVTHSEKTEQYLYDSLKVNNEEICADPEQYFFCPKSNAWIKLIELDIEKDCVLSHLQGAIPMQNRGRVTTILRDVKIPMYKISVEKYQNFLITKQCILVHNYAPPVVPLSAILINSVIDLGVNLAASYISELISLELAPRLKTACTGLLPINAHAETTKNSSKITTTRTAQCQKKLKLSFQWKFPSKTE